MAGTVTQDFGCTGFVWEPPLGTCAHFHQGIDIVAAVRHAGPARPATGKVVYCGWNYADGADPAWIVIIAHSQSLETWYAHMQPNCPVGAGGGVSTRARSSATRATPATRPAPTSTGPSASTATS